ncbi:MAG: hydrogen peroxide-inducible genes activator, partial [Ectothiorhodospiraceae bacterium]|nr:hydrogen peroxide-inducible genes activator [Ectothiorhodospiraceae bacterium]
MTLTELRYIVAVARERHFGRAAASCHVSQPTLSVAVKRLEDELGVMLFERNRNDVTPTPAGERIVQQASRVLEEAETLRQLAKSGRDQLVGPLRLGAIFTIAPYLLPHLIPALHEIAPKMPLTIEENYTARLSEHLKQGDLDAIIISLPFDEPGVVTLPLYDEPFVALLPSSHPLAEQETLSLERLADDTLLMLGPGHCFRDQIFSVCPRCSRSIQAEGLQGTIEGGSLETIRHMVASGLGVTVLPCTAAGADRYAQRLVAVRRFEPPVPTRRVALAWRTSFPRPKAIEALR